MKCSKCGYVIKKQDEEKKVKYSYKYAGMAALLIFCIFIYVGYSSKNSGSVNTKITDSTLSKPEKKTHSAAVGPKCTQDNMWKYVVNNAYRTADEYAMSRNPNSTFVSTKNNYSFIKQIGGEFEGNFLLIIINKHGGNTSFAVLLPLFDVNMPSEGLGLDDNQPLWKVVNAKFNGRPY